MGLNINLRLRFSPHSSFKIIPKSVFQFWLKSFRSKLYKSTKNGVDLSVSADKDNLAMMNKLPIKLPCLPGHKVDTSQESYWYAYNLLSHWEVWLSENTMKAWLSRIGILNIFSSVQQTNWSYQRELTVILGGYIICLTRPYSHRKHYFWFPLTIVIYYIIFIPRPKVLSLVQMQKSVKIRCPCQNPLHLETC